MHPDPAFQWPKTAAVGKQADAAFDATERRVMAHLMQEFGET